jgi:hypothetical protein
MKSFFVQTVLILSLVFGYNSSNAQSENAPDTKSKGDCSTEKSCCTKETKETALAASFAVPSLKKDIADCLFKGTAECPFVKDCPLKGTAECPLVKGENRSIQAVKKTTDIRKVEADLPACCKKSS